jgi:hypothetical protein
MDTRSSPSGRRRWKRIRRIVNYVFLVALPVSVTASSGFAAVGKGTLKVALILLAIFFTLLAASLSVYKEIQSGRANKSAIIVATAVNESGQPLITLLGRVSAAKTGNERRSAINTLIEKTVGIARSSCGHFGFKRCSTRGVFYQLVSDTRLERHSYEGRQGVRLPRQSFEEGRNDNDRRVLEITRGENSLLVRDVDTAPPEYFSDYRGRPYKSFLMVPVRAGGRSYGFLSVDSDQPYSLTEVDVGYVRLMAGALGAAIAQLGGDYPPLRGHTGV